MALRLVSPSRGNAFMTELLAVLTAELRGQGVDAELVADRFPAAEPGVAYVVIPHEYFGTVAPGDHPSAAQLARTVALTTEQPGSPWFEHAEGPAQACARIADISTVGVVEWRRRGIAAEHLPLGYTPMWDPWNGDESAERDVDIVILGSLNRRRDHYLAGYADVLAEHESRLVLAPMDPKPEGRPGVLLGAARSALLARSRIALHVRMQRPPYFEWLRAIQALSAGAVLVGEHGAGAAPLVAGEHFVSGTAENLALLADALLRDPGELERLRAAGYAALRAGPSMADAARRLAELAEPLAAAPSAPRRHERTASRDAALVDVADPAAAPLRPPPGDAGRVAAKRLLLEVGALSRRIAALELRQRGLDPAELLTVATTPTFAATQPRVTVAITLYNHEQEIEAAIASVAAQDSDEPFDLLILDDASTDGSLAAAQAAVERRPWLPAQLVGRRVNAGLPRGRNDLLARARAGYVLVLDSDNSLYPQALRRLAGALDAAPDAAFAYGIMAGHRAGAPEGLLSSMPWDPSRMRDLNPIDAFSLLRREAIVGMGGYSQDTRLHGWEDYDLWCRIAEAGGRGEHVPNFLARYQRSDTSMLSLTDLDQTVARAVLAEHSPRVMAAALDA